MHRAVICTQSAILRAACAGHFAVMTSFSAVLVRIADNTTQETKSYTILDAESKHVDRMIEFMYTGDYSDVSCDELPILPSRQRPRVVVPSSSNSRVVFCRTKANNSWDIGDAIPNNPPPRDDASLEKLRLHIEMLSLADKYMVDDLIAKATENFDKEVHEHRDSLQFLDVIPYVYEVWCESGKALRNVCIEAARTCFGTHLESGGTQRDAFDAALETTPQFARDLLYSCMIVSSPAKKQPAKRKPAKRRKTSW